MSENNPQDRIESQGATVEEAVSEALLMLGARRDEVEIEVLEEGKAGLLGLFGKKAARVAVTRRRKRSRGRRGGRRRGRRGGAKPQPEARTDSRGESRGERKDEGRGGRRPAARRDDRDDRGGRQERKARDQGGRGRGDERRERPPRRRPEKSRTDEARTKRPDPAPREVAAGGDPEPSRERSRRPRRRPTRHRPGDPVETAPEHEAASAPRTDEPSAAPKPEPTPAMPAGETFVPAELVPPTRDLDVAAAAGVQRDLGEELMRRAGFAARVTVEEGDYNQVKVIADVDSAAVLIGRHGSTIDAVEHLVDRMAVQAVGERVPMNLDINNYRKRRHGTLEENALAAVRQLRDTEKDVHTPPLVARERRIVHLAIEGIEGVTTYTAGAGPDRHVVVTFEKDEAAEPEAPELEVAEPAATEPEAAEPAPEQPEPEQTDDPQPEPAVEEPKPDAEEAP